jgi:NAD-dependent deacetylase
MADFEKAGFNTTVVTQNIDGLHEKAGSSRVLELHGTVLKNECMDCGAEYCLDNVITSMPGPPYCKSCGGLIKPCVTLYEEALDERTYMKAFDKISNADVLIAVGSSLTVYPAAGLLEHFKGDVFAIVNRTPTPFDKRAGYVFHENAGTVLPRILKEIGYDRPCT